ncbi:hypothetical protein VTK73DRAFT_816 [Phialemonium thermophilum]|uniref:PX domain-containing protein n=1 Tax=Phialemonium thermophilum TaxID=223376 RepID=A0ABR3VUF4_9PEZI
MATIDQDNFSNISWHSEHNNGQGSSRETPSRDAPSAGDPEQAPAEGPAERAAPAVPREDLEFDLGGEVLECTVSEPHKENDGTKDAYVSYLITTHSTFPSFQKPTTTVRRRFTDFVFLYKALSKDYQAAAVPPLPDKQRMDAS